MHPAGIKVTEIVKIIAKEWGLLSKKQKNIYKDQAKMDKLRYENELNQLSLGRVGDVTPMKPKKPLTPYMIFVRETRKMVVDTMPHVRSLNIMKEVGKIWKTVTNEELERLKNLAKKDLDRYMQEHEKFVREINLLRKRG